MTAAHAILLAALALAAWTDFRRRVIPNGITYPAITLILAVRFAAERWEGLLAASLGVAVCGGLVLLAWLTGALGGGDVKLVAVIGAALGWIDGLHALMWTFTLAAVWMLSRILWTEGLKGVLRSLRPESLDAGIAATVPSHVRPIDLAPAALAAAILITWP